jgi:hypothetical protein
LKPGIQVRILVPEHEATQLVTGAPSHGDARGSIPWPRTGAGRCGSPELSDKQLASVHLRAAPREASELVNTPV